MEESAYDHAAVELSNDPGDPNAWVTVFDHSGTTLIETSWSLQDYDISAVADDQPAVYIRWAMGPTDYDWNYGGWNIDDVEVYGGSIVWSWAGGDLDCDGDVDLDDYAAIEAAMNGPEQAPGDPDTDLDGDNDCDLADVAIFAANFTGPL